MKKEITSCAIQTDLGVNEGACMICVFLIVLGFYIVMCWAGLEASGQIQHGNEPQPPYPMAVADRK